MAPKWTSWPWRSKPLPTTSSPEVPINAAANTSHVSENRGACPGSGGRNGGSVQRRSMAAQPLQAARSFSNSELTAPELLPDELRAPFEPAPPVFDLPWQREPLQGEGSVPRTTVLVSAAGADEACDVSRKCDGFSRETPFSLGEPCGSQVPDLAAMPPASQTRLRAGCMLVALRLVPAEDTALLATTRPPTLLVGSPLGGEGCHFAFANSFSRASSGLRAPGGPGGARGDGGPRGVVGGGRGRMSSSDASPPARDRGDAGGRSLCVGMTSSVEANLRRGRASSARRVASSRLGGDDGDPELSLLTAAGPVCSRGLARPAKRLQSTARGTHWPMTLS
mmetsp:Transcript_93632/g.264281  ORF Transcript_93632/g.264281 Transcript_93632/m.264281 type:complete len:337 (+) Transcript_93632:743-1753(+)